MPLNDEANCNASGGRWDKSLGVCDITPAPGIGVNRPVYVEEESRIPFLSISFMRGIISGLIPYLLYYAELFFATQYTSVFGAPFRTNPVIFYIVPLLAALATPGVSLFDVFAPLPKKDLILGLAVGSIIILAFVGILTGGGIFSSLAVTPYVEQLLSTTSTSSGSSALSTGLIASVVVIGVMEELLVIITTVYFASAFKNANLGLSDMEALMIGLIMATGLWVSLHVFAYGSEGILSFGSLLMAFVIGLVVLRFPALFTFKRYNVWIAIGGHVTYDALILLMAAAGTAFIPTALSVFP